MEIQQSDIFAVDVQALQVAEKKVETAKGIPTGYIPVSFCSKNVMGPEVLHFRNYSMGELLELASSNEENQMNILVNRVLNSMCYEKFDCSKLHMENIKEIVLSIYLNFWNSKLLQRPYYIDTDIDDYDKDENIGYTDIEIKKINIKDIDPKFRNPFSIVDSATKKKVKFCLPTVEQMFVADKAINEKYANEEQRFALIRSRLTTKKALLEKNLLEQADSIQVSVDEENSLNDLEQRKAKDYLRFLQCQLLVSIDNDELKTIEEKMLAFDTNVDATTWIRYTEIVKKYADFGVDELYTFSIDEKVITRRFSFRFLEFIPSMDQRTDTGYSVRFDD